MVYVVGWLAFFKSSCASTYVVAAFGVSRLSTSVLVYMLVAVSGPDTVPVADVRISVAVADALTNKLNEFVALSYLIRLLSSVPSEETSIVVSPDAVISIPDDVELA